MADDAKLYPTILNLASAFPERVMSQDELWDRLLNRWYADLPNAREVIDKTRVRTRHMAWDPCVEVGLDGRGTGDRMAAYETAVAEVGGAAVERAVDGVDRERIGSFVMASCTGYAGPTPDLHLARRFGLSATLRRTFVGHMGCYAAFNALKVALDAVAARPDELALVACAEFSSLHFRQEATIEQAVIHGLFGDASAALVLGAAPKGAGPQILATRTVQAYETADMMTWTVLDDGFRMTLSPYVPFVLSGSIRGFVDDLCAAAGVDPAAIRHWGIHPGGPKIVEMIAEKLEIPDERLESTWRILETRGNCSSTTVLLVLEDMLRANAPAPGEIGVVMAFGPGLTMEGALIRF